MNDFPWLVRLYDANAITCHGYLIDESWLVAPSDCFTGGNRANTNEDNLALGWTAEISHEHYGNDFYKSIESNRRTVKRVLIPPLTETALTSSPSSSSSSSASASVVLTV